MAGIKTSKGQQVHHSKHYAKGQEWVPCKVVCPKIMGKGTKMFMSAQSKHTGEIYKNSQGRPMPWKAIPFTTIKPEGLD